MSRVYFISDLHLGHDNIHYFEPNYRSGDTGLENHENILNNLSRKLTKRDTLFVIGDVCLAPNEKDNLYWLFRLGEIPCTKYLIRGNHDELPIEEYLKAFDDVYGSFKYRGYWVSHFPMHPDELYGKQNIHGHVHRNTIKDSEGNWDKRYINVCCEALGEEPIDFQDIKSGKYWGIKRV